MCTVWNFSYSGSETREVRNNTPHVAIFGSRRVGVYRSRNQAQRPAIKALQAMLLPLETVLPKSPYRGAADRLPPSTVSTAPVVFSDRARWTKARATSSAVTSMPSRLPAM